MKRPLGVSSACFRESFEPSVLALLAEAGFSHLEVAAFCHADLEQPGAIANLGKQAREAGLVTWSLHAPFGMSVNLAAADETGRRAATASVSAALNQAQELGASVVVVHPGYQEPGEERQAALVRVVRGLNELWKRASQRGLTLAVEYLPPKPADLGSSVEELLWLAGLIDGEISFCTDVNHINLSESLPEVLRRLGQRIVTTHLSDNDGEMERHWLPGEGIIAWPELLTTLDTIGYSGPLLLESGNFVSESIGDRVSQLRSAAKAFLGS
ncbi:MAG: sugar phosphate isomerase/epimerase family protein [Bacteroidota bacterium]